MGCDCQFFWLMIGQFSFLLPPFVTVIPPFSRFGKGFFSIGRWDSSFFLAFQFAFFFFSS